MRFSYAPLSKLPLTLGTPLESSFVNEMSPIKDHQLVTVKMFACKGKLGEKLASKVLSMGKDMGLNIEVIWEATNPDFIMANLCDHIVIIDGSTDGNCELYRTADESCRNLDHVLIVSRTFLPINFVSQRRGGAPSFPYPFESPIELPAAKEWNNDTITLWLKDQIEDILRVPIKRRMRPDELVAYWQEGKYTDELRNFWEDHSRTKPGGEGIFISYRNRNYTQVQILADKIQSGEFCGIKRSVLMFPPGQLAFENELLSPLRRWQLMSELYSELKKCREIWIYWTEDYLDSWWTSGELMLIKLIELVYGYKIKIKVYKDGHICDNNNYPEVTMTEEEMIDIAMIIQEVDPTLMGLDRLKFLRFAKMLKLLRLDWLFKKMIIWTAKKINEKGLPDPIETMNKVIGEDEYSMANLAGESLEGFRDSIVMTKGFVRNICVDLPKRQAYTLHAGEFLKAPQHQMIKLDLYAVKFLAFTAFPIRLKGFQLRIRKTVPRLIWQPSFAPGTVHGRVVKLPTYLCEWM